MARTAATIVTILALIITAPALATPVGPADNEIAQLSRDIERSLNEVAALDARLETTTKEIIRAYQELDSQESNLNTQKKALDSRIGEVYKNYDELVLGVFLDATSFSDVWKRLAFLAKVNEADNALLAANKTRLEQIRELKQALAEKKLEQIELKRLKQTEYSNLQLALLQKKALLEIALRQAQGAGATAYVDQSTTAAGGDGTRNLIPVVGN